MAISGMPGKCGRCAVFKLDMTALRKTANCEVQIPANAANFSHVSAATPHKLAALAGLAGCSDSTIAAVAAANDPVSAEPPVQENLRKPKFAESTNDPEKVVGLVAVDEVTALVTPQREVMHDPDRWAWPQSSAMNAREIGIFTARFSRFTDKGLSLSDGEALADKLVIRDREPDDRRVCLECRHFAGHGAGSWRCGNWLTAGIATHSRDAQLPADLVLQLQRCDGFTPHLTSTLQGKDDDHAQH